MKQRNNNSEIDGLISSLFNNHSCKYRISINVIHNLLDQVSKVFQDEQTLLELSSPITVCGDIHGQFPDLIRIFENNGKPPNQKYLFLGDYIDRGTMGLESICLLLGLKVKYPGHIYLIRGNHETREMTAEYGFSKECISKSNKKIYEEFCNMFDLMPIAALIGGKILCVHGGISPELNTLEQIKEIKRPADASYKGMLSDILWSDPLKNVQEWGPSERGDTVVWGKKPLHKFLDQNNLSILIRAHQMVQNGYDYPFEPDRSIITIFSAPCYANEFKNRGAFLLIDNNLKVEPIQLPHEPNSMKNANKIKVPFNNKSSSNNNNNRGKKNSFNRNGKKQRGRR